MSHDDFAIEPVPGLPALPPEGERILWSGSPHWSSLARHALHIDKIAIYFVLLIAWRMGSQWYGASDAAAIAGSALVPVVIATAAVSILATIAYAMARSTVYTITSRRLVMRFGVALPITFNLPFVAISKVGLRRLADAKGDLPVELSESKRLPYLVLWPHVRPWRFRAPQPMLRCVYDAPLVANILSGALASHAALSAPAAPTMQTTHDLAQPEPAMRAPRLVAAE
jgi:hypothetical protein